MDNVIEVNFNRPTFDELPTDHKDLLTEIQIVSFYIENPKDSNDEFNVEEATAYLAELEAEFDGYYPRGLDPCPSDLKAFDGAGEYY